MSKKIALAFSGGGCSIIYYSALCRILQEKGYEIEAVSAVSSGCFISMPLAAGYSPKEVEELLRKYYATYNEIHFEPKWRNAYGLCTNKNIGDVLDHICAKKGIKKMKDFKFPIIIKSVNAQTGEPVYFTNMDIPGVKCIKEATPKEAIMASTAFPGLYKGVKVHDDEGNYILCTDGGARGNVAVTPLKKVIDYPVYACIYNKSNKKTKGFLGIVKTLVFGALDSITNQELENADQILKIERTNAKVLDVKVKRFDEMREEGERQIRNFLGTGEK